MFARTTRRSALAALAGAALAPFPGTAARKAIAFALIGDRYHNSDYVRIALTRTIAKELGVTIDFTDETSLLNPETDRKSTRLNSSHLGISYAVFCLKKK